MMTCRLALAVIFLFSSRTPLARAAALPHETRAPWWKQGVIYQIYPRSFQDTSGDGIGDLPGVIKRLDYVKDLGVGAIWLSPFYPSPMKDFGYDISDYTDVDPMFGRLDDFTALTAQAHQRDLKVVIDFVINHTSDQHPWFLAARRGKSDPKRDWYVWANPAKDGGPPNNWLSVFGGSAWTFDQASGQYYYHAFLPSQPDLNWHNPAVEAAIHEVMRFWLDRGVDGFRVDAIGQLLEDDQRRDEPKNAGYTPAQAEYDKLDHVYTFDQAKTHEVLRGLRRVVDSYPGDRLLITEAYLPFDRQVTYYGSPAAPEAQLPFNFLLIGAKWQGSALAKLVETYEHVLPPFAWPDWVLGNHDQPRLASRLGADQVRVAAMLLLTLRGTPTLYYGDEIGLPNVPVPPALVQDPVEKQEPGKGLGRDPERSPMQWSAAPNAGFSSGQPWLPVEPQFAKRNVAQELADPSSVLNLYRALLHLRNKEAALATGSYRTVAANKSLFAYERQSGQQRFVVALNLGGKAQPLPPLPVGTSVVLSTAMDLPESDGKGALPQLLRPHEGLILRLPSRSAGALPRH